MHKLKLRQQALEKIRKHEEAKLKNLPQLLNTIANENKL